MNFINKALNNFGKFARGEENLYDKVNRISSGINASTPTQKALKALLVNRLNTGAGLSQGTRDLVAGTNKVIVDYNKGDPINNGLFEAGKGAVEMAPMLLELTALGKLSQAPKVAPKTINLAKTIAENTKNRDALGRFTKVISENPQLMKRLVPVVDRSGSEVVKRFIKL